jgi:hypothetical protein
MNVTEKGQNTENSIMKLLTLLRKNIFMLHLQQKTILKKMGFRLINALL